MSDVENGGTHKGENSMSSGFDGLPALPEPEWHDSPPMYGQRQMWAYAIEHARQLAEQRAELLDKLEILTTACEEEFCGEGTEAIEPDDSKVAFPEDQCHITFGMIRSARAAIANATQQRNATGGEG